MNFKKIISFIFVLALVLFSTKALAQNIGSLKSVVTPGFSFTMDLSPGYTDADVIELQRVLNADVDTTIALQGEGSRGKETKYFGDKTKLAVIKFQEKHRDTILTPYGLTKGTGIVGKATRTKLNLLIGVMSTSDSVGVPESRGSSASTITTTTTTTTNTNTASENCQFIELLISVDAIVPGQESTALGLFGCAGGTSTGKTPRVDVKVNGKDSTVDISSPRNVTVSWTSSNVTSCASPNKTKPLSGSESFYVEESGTFVISCTGPYGTVTDSVAVRLNEKVSSCTSYTYSDWSSCVGGTQTRSKLRSSPSNCSGGVSAVTSRTCTVTPPATLACTSFTYDDWSACVGGTQTRNKLTSVPASCTGGVTASTTQSCSNLEVSCLPSPSTGPINTLITWISTIISGGNGGYAYSWSGTDGLYGNSSFASKTYATTGTKTAQVTVTSGTALASTTCNVIISSSTTPFSYDSLFGTTTASTTNPSTINGPEDVANIVGYGVVNDWMNISSVSLASQLSTNKLTATNIEMLGHGNKGYYDNPQSIYPKLKTFVKDMRAKNVTTLINIVNWNKGSNTWNNGGVSICEAKYSDAWFSSILDFLINEIGTDRIVLQAASEWSGGRNNECDDKAQRWEDMVADRWDGMISSNKGTRPEEPINEDWFFEYHPCSLTDYGPDGAIITTDCGGAITGLADGSTTGFANTKKLKAYACKVMEDNSKGFMYYAWGHSKIDTAAIVALGQVVANPGDCEAVEEEIPEELGPEVKNQVAGLVTSVDACTPTNSFAGKLYQVAIKPCKEGDIISSPDPKFPGGTTSASEGYVVIREGHGQAIPTVGQTIMGTAVEDGGLECSNPVSTGSYFGTMSGAMGLGADCGSAGSLVNSVQGGSSNGSSIDWWMYVSPTTWLQANSLESAGDTISDWGSDIGDAFDRF